MGGIPKKFTVLRALLLCLAVVFSLMSITASISLFRTTNNSVPSPSADNADEQDELKWVNLVSGTIGGFSDHDDTNKTALISTEGALANLNRAISDNTVEYSGWTFIIDRDLDMARYYNNHNELCKPLWTPINAAAGRNTGIIIDGNGHTISNLLIEMDDDATSDNGVEAQNGVGFFGNLTGCTIRNLTFEDTVINYTYTGDSKLATDETRPTAPVKVAVGVVAGIAENAYISNVDIINPQVNVTTNNANGHSIYVGTAVGKMIYGDQAATPLLQSLTNPDEEPEHRWGVDTVTVTGGKVGLTVNAGEDATAGAYGVATNGYLGGLVGYNNSGKIINSKVKGLTVNPQMAGVAGTYHAGGLVGYTMLRVPTLNDVVLSGVINNIIMDTTVTAGQATYTGMLAGYVYGNWLYNNLYLGSTTQLVGAFYNRYYITFNNDKCLANLDYETFVDNDYFRVVADKELVGTDKACYVNYTSDHYAVCTRHGYRLVETLFPYIGNESDRDKDSAYEQYANQYNYQMTKTEFLTFQSSDTFKKLDDFENENGNFYEIGTQKVTHEYQTEVNNANIRRAVNELRVWQVVKGEPQFGDNLGYDYDIVFHANGEQWASLAASEAGLCNAGWVVKGDYFDTINTELVKKCKYKELITALSGDEKPTTVGWEFDGWYEDPECTSEFKFNTTMGTATIDIYAKWKLNSYKVSYYLDDETPYCVENDVPYEETVPYGRYVVGPSVIKPELPREDRFYGKSATGNWYIVTETYEYDESGNQITVLTRGENWAFGMLDYTPMPGYDIKLYAELEDNFVVLRQELESTAVTDAFSNREYYTEESFSRFEIAYDNAYTLMKDYDDGAEEARDKYVDQVIDELRNSLAALMVDIEGLRNLPPFDESLDQNQYPFLYNFDNLYDSDGKIKYTGYKEYMEIKRTAQNYLNVEIKNEGMLYNLERYKYIRDALMTKYNNLGVNRNPNLGLDADLIAEVKRGYTQIMAEIDTFNPDDYTAESWKNSDFELYCTNFKETFKSDYSNPHIDDMKAAIDNFNLAKSQLVLGSGTANPNKPSADNNQSGGMPLIVIGVLVALAAVIGAGAYVGVDLYLNKKVRPKKEQAEKAEQAAAEDTYI